MADPHDDETIIPAHVRSARALPRGPITETIPVLMTERFEILRPLGEGGMGKVYLVRDRHIEGREVALKVLRKHFSRDADFKRLFFREIKLAQQFVSPHVNQVRDTGQLPDGSLFLTMDFVDGESLHAKLAREHVMLPRHALEIARQVLLGLSSGHEKGIVHRDVKPHNIMLQRRVAKTEHNPNGVDVRLLDFGIAACIGDMGGEGASGTPAYMSPEQAVGQALDPRSDLFSVGLVLFEMIAGERLFHGKTLREIETSLLNLRIDTRVAELTGVQKPIKKILAQALQKDRDKRFQSSSEFIRAIEKSKAYRLPTSVPVWAWCVMGGLALVAGTRGTILAGDNRAELNSLGLELAQEKAKVEFENKGYAEKLRAAGDAKTSAVAAKLDAEQRLETGTRIWANAEANLKREIGEKDLNFSNLRYTNQLNEKTLTGREEDLEIARETIKKLERKIEELDDKVRRLNPEYRCARALDRILEFQQGAQPGEARKTFQEEQKVGFSSMGTAGAEFVEALVIAADELGKFQRSSPGSPDIAAYFRAKPKLEQARDLREAFPSVAKAWLSLDEPAPGERLAAVDRELKSLVERFDGARSSCEANHIGQWNATRAAGPLQDPRPAQDHSILFGCDHVAQLARDAADAMQEALVDDIRLDRKELATLDILPSWIRVMQGYEAIPVEARNRLIVFDAARRFYDTAAKFDGPLPDELDAYASSGDRQGWAAKLSIAGRLLEGGARYPYSTGDKLVYAVTHDGRTTFWEERVDTTAKDTNPDEYSFRREIYDLDGSVVQKQQESRMNRRGKVWTLGTDSSPVLDLGADEATFRIVEIERLPDPALPATLSLNAAERAEFARAWAASDRTCLVWTRGDTEIFVSPVWGLVRHVRTTPKGETRRELVYSNRSKR